MLTDGGGGGGGGDEEGSRGKMMMIINLTEVVQRGRQHLLADVEFWKVLWAWSSAVVRNCVMSF